MIITFQVLLLFIIFMSFAGAIGEENRQLRTNVTAVCITAIISFLVSVMYL